MLRQFSVKEIRLFLLTISLDITLLSSWLFCSMMLFISPNENHFKKVFKASLPFFITSERNNLFEDRFTCRFAFKSHFAVLIVRCLIFTLASKRLSNLDEKQTLSLILISFLHCCFCNRINLKVSYSVSQINDECLRKKSFYILLWKIWIAILFIRFWPNFDTEGNGRWRGADKMDYLLENRP